MLRKVSEEKEGKAGERREGRKRKGRQEKEGKGVVGMLCSGRNVM